MYSHFSYSRKNIYLKFLTTEASTFPGIQCVHLFVFLFPGKVYVLKNYIIAPVRLPSQFPSIHCAPSQPLRGSRAPYCCPWKKYCLTSSCETARFDDLSKIIFQISYGAGSRIQRSVNVLPASSKNLPS